VAFDVVFGVFAAAMVAIALFAIKWAVGRDRASRREKEGVGSEAAAEIKP
jgi:hypothetical protein